MRTIGIITGIIAAGIIGICVVSYVSAYNKGNAMERALIAAVTDNKQVLATYGNKIAEMAQIPAMQRDDLAEVIERALDARYGEEGSQAVFQFIQEQNPQIDSSVYTNIQNEIAAGRTQFQNKQTVLLDKKRVYETALGSFWTGTWLGITGYPKIDLNDIKVVTSTRAEEIFDSGTEEPLKLR